MKMGMKFYQLTIVYKKKTNLLRTILSMLTLCVISASAIADTIKKSGYYFAEPSTREIQDDDFMNPGFLWVEIGKNLWKKNVLIQNESFSCQSCHGDPENMRGISLKYPKVLNEKLINLEQRINLCRTKNMLSEEFDIESKNLLGLSTLITVQSRGMKQNIEINSDNKDWYELGKKLYFKKIGQMGLSCNQCHDDRVGLNLRAEKVSQGHVNGFPSYLLRWSKVASVHRRIQFCNEQARAEPYKIFSKEYNALQLYLSWRGNGLSIESPSVRK
ncbi:MAG: sulfur oxidation c-type cytochrome SoxA [Rickettsiales bacterium]|nr:sulfur oxidation c-type cytochrome SoxA [Rickettsiales bacterium]